MPKANRRVLSVTVELPVVGDLLLSDFRWHVERALSRGLLESTIRSSSLVESTGRLQIKQTARVGEKKSAS